jgi:hypothetical protein
VVVALSLAVALTTLPASPASATAVPPTPSGLPAAVEAWQPYVGQSICDPVAKPGVRAFSTIVLDTYRDTTSMGIVRDCGSGGQSEHKEGRAWDWGVSVHNPSHVASVDALLGWLLATDGNGNQAAMARRLGIMYIIWNKRIWKSYAADKGWQAYTGASPHTDHVHFSFGWNGARQTTSYWSGKVAPIDYGPTGAGKAPIGFFDAVLDSSTGARAVGWAADPDTYLPIDVVVAVAGTTRRVRADKVRADVGAAYPELGPDHGFEVSLDDVPDGDHSVCVTAVNATGTGGGDTSLGCRAFAPRHAAVGAFDGVASGPQGTFAWGWALDYDTPAAISVRLSVNGGTPRTVVADQVRPDIGAAFPAYGSAHGFRVELEGLADGTHDVCVTALNAPGTIGASSNLGCRSVLVRHDAVGHADAVGAAAGGARVQGWAGDPDGAPTPVVVTAGSVTQVVHADLVRPDVQSAYPWLGPRTGFDARISLWALPEGTHPVCMTARSIGRGKDRALGCAPVQVRHEPFGFPDLMEVVPGGIRVAGWMVEPDVDGPGAVRISTSYGHVVTVGAGGARPDIGRAFPAYGSDKGFDALIPAPAAEGVHRVCADAVNAGPGRDQRLGCRDLTVRHTPVGHLDAASFQSSSALRVKGWALDPDSRESLAVHVYVDGRYAGQVLADQERPDVDRLFVHHGARHGYDGVLTGAWGPGDRRVCTWAIDVGPAPQPNPLLGCQTVRLG